MYKVLRDRILGRKQPKYTKINNWYMSKNLDENVLLFKKILNNDETIAYRFFETRSDVRCCILFVDGMINNEIINENLIKPIIKSNYQKNDNSVNHYLKEVIFSSRVEINDNVDEIISSILYGETFLLIDGCDKGLVIDTRKFNERAIHEPESEKIIRGPKEGFNESIFTNITLLRRKIQSHNLKYKFKTVGRVTKTKVCISYIDNIVNKKILREVEKRIDDIDIDSILDSGYIEELIKDEPLSPFNTLGCTERPDIVAANLLEGRVAIFVDGSPHVLTAPYVFIEYFQANEDYYNGYIYSSINRLLRIVAFFISTSLPAIYVSLTTFHQEMIPTPLLLAISASREGVPFPTIVEATLMLLAFELLREGGVRLPSPIGQSISFVGAIILGQASVNARFVSAPIVIIAALTGITSYLTPTMLGALIIIRFVFIILSSFLGLYGYIFGVMGLLIHLMSIRSFGVPYMINIGSINKHEIKDTIIRAPWWLMFYRSRMISSDNSIRKTKTKIKKKVKGI